MGSSQAQIVLGTRKFDVHPEPKKREWGWHNIGELVRLVNGLLRVDESPVKTIERYILMGYPPSQTVNQPSIDVVLDVKKSLICQPFTMREFSLYETILAEGYVPSGWGDMVVAAVMNHGVYQAVPFPGINTPIGLSRARMVRASLQCFEGVQ